MADDLDVFIGRRLRRRRGLVGMTQLQVGEAVGVRFQQIQKYECGANRLSAARLWMVAQVLEVPVSYFFDGIGSNRPSSRASGECDRHSEKETQDLVRAYYQLDERPRSHLLRLARVLSAETAAREAPASV